MSPAEKRWILPELVTGGSSSRNQRAADNSIRSAVRLDDATTASHAPMKIFARTVCLTPMKRGLPAALVTVLASALLLTSAFAHAEKKKYKKSVHAQVRSATPEKRKPSIRQAQAVPKAIVRDGEAEARLIDIYKLIGQAKTREALSKAEKLVQDHPNFQLAQLVYGDLLTAQSRPVRQLGDVPDTTAKAAGPLLAELRDESVLRLKALRERPAPGMVPSQFLSLSAANKHAIAIDASRSRLYLFENTGTGMKLLADYYISVGKSGIEKNAEGDLRTPLGVYFITSNLNPKSLKDFYGSGALPVNYPNQLDVKRGKTGGGIWLHGTPPTQYSRAPLATDGCVVLSNPDLERIISTVEIRTTPVVIAQHLKWVAPQSVKAESKTFEDALNGWHAAKSSGDFKRVSNWYAADFTTNNGKTLAEWAPALRAEMDKLGGREIQLKDVSYLHWTDAADTMVVTFGELIQGSKTGRIKRQYWSRQGNQWKIFYEGVIG
jgi:L,D-transpeptidase YnhG